MASIDDLNLSPWEPFVEQIDFMLASKQYEWAYETLEGIRDTVRQRQCVTDKQRQAVDNIEEGGERHRDRQESREYDDRRRGSRRYEGFRR